MSDDLRVDVRVSDLVLLLHLVEFRVELRDFLLYLFVVVWKTVCDDERGLRVHLKPQVVLYRADWLLLDHPSVQITWGRNPSVQDLRLP